jgi:hypothetical protein
MRMREIEVSIEYLDNLCKWMEEWGEKEDSLTFTQFLKTRGIGYGYFKYFQWRSPKVNNCYEMLKYTLHNRWLQKAMNSKDLPQHQAKVLMKYLSLYDSHARDLAEQERKAIAEVEKVAEMNYKAENYASVKLDGFYNGYYEQNANKRRSS